MLHSRRLGSRASLVAAVAVTGFCARPLPAVSAPFVASIAGNGHAALTDGAAANASFLMPSAVAVASDGTVYVTDAAAHNVRRIKHGRVETFAGTSEPGPSADERIGGFVSGAASVARFSRPDGIAVARDGSVYVADAGNDCIRKIARGNVTTFAGSKMRGNADGHGAAATFENIRGLAIDGDGNLYVADDGVGIRKISPSADVSTLKLQSSKRTIVAVAARGSGSHLELAYSDHDTMHIIVNGADQSVDSFGSREPGDSALTVGFADAIAIVNENTLIVCDVAANAVRLVRLPSLPFVTDTMTRALAGGVREGSDLGGGFAEGASDTALVSVPLGVALAPDGSIVVADAGNRRIRKIEHVDMRESVLADYSNFAPAKNAYNIAIVGNSYAFFNVLWPESIGGMLEAGLNRDLRYTGLGKHTAVTTFRIDDLAPAAQTTLIRNELGDGQVDLIILLANYYEPPDRALFHDLETELAARHTKLCIVFTPQGYETSPLEFWKANVATPEYDYATLREHAAREESYVESLNAHALLLLDAMQRAESAPGRRNFFYGADHHLTVYGSQWVGRAILDDLERWKPWR